MRGMGKGGGGNRKGERPLRVHVAPSWERGGVDSKYLPGNSDKSTVSHGHLVGERGGVCVGGCGVQGWVFNFRGKTRERGGGGF